VAIPPVAWQVTGNHWVTVPCIHPADGALHALGLVHRGSRSAVEYAGAPDFASGQGPAFARPVIRVNGMPEPILGDGGEDGSGLTWERTFGWLPAFTGAIGSLVVRGTIFAPFGPDADHAGVVYAISVENRGEDARVSVALEGVLGHRQQRVRTGRSFPEGIVAEIAGNVVVLSGRELPGVATLAIGGDDDTEVTTGRDVRGAPIFALTRDLVVAGGTTANAAFYIAFAPEPDGAEILVRSMRGTTWRTLLDRTRDALRGLEQSTGSTAVDRLVNQNLLFAYFYGVARAIDDQRFYVVRTRSPWHGRGMTVREWDALAWLIPAIQLADAPLARELILRACEVHGDAPGRGVRYLDGAMFEPGFSIEGAAAYALAVERYIRETGDDQIVEESVLADTLYASADTIASRRSRDIPLYGTDRLLSGGAAPVPYLLHANAVVALALEVFRRTLDEETAKRVPDAAAVRAAMARHFAVEREGKPALAAGIDLRGGVVMEDDSVGSILWLPLYDAVDRQDSAYRRTVKGLGAPSEEGQPLALAQQCARLVGPEAGAALAWLRRAPLDNGVAAEWVDAEGRAVANGGDAALAGLVAYTVWYAVHALGVTP
jgi:hypothetical protein